MKVLAVRRFPSGYYVLPAKAESLFALMRSRQRGGARVKAKVLGEVPPPLFEVPSTDAFFVTEVDNLPEEKVPLHLSVSDWGASLAPEDRKGEYSALMEWESLAYLAERLA